MKYFGRFVKGFLILMVSILTISCAAFGSSKYTSGINDSDADIGSDQIVITLKPDSKNKNNLFTTDELLQIVSNHFYNEGFDVRVSKDKKLRVKTEFRNGKKLKNYTIANDLAFALTANFKKYPNRIFLSGKYMDKNNNINRIEKAGSNVSKEREAWRVLHKISADLGTVEGYKDLK